MPALIRLQRQVSYFGDQEGIDGLLKHIADDDTNCQILRKTSSGGILGRIMKLTASGLP